MSSNKKRNSQQLELMLDLPEEFVEKRGRKKSVVEIENGDFNLEENGEEIEGFDFDEDSLLSDKDIEEIEKELEELEEFEFGDTDLETIFSEEYIFENCDDIDEEVSREDENLYYRPMGSSLSQDEKELMAYQNIKLVYSVVNKYSKCGYEYTELFSAALVGLNKAIQNFDPQKLKNGKKIKFTTYAWRCIENEIILLIRKEKKIRDKTESYEKVIAFDKNGNSLNLESTLSDASMGIPTLEESFMKNEVIKITLEVIDEYLDEKEQLIIKHRFGISNYDEKTQNELAELTNMSQANISKLEKTILDKIRKIMISKYKIKGL